MQYAVTLFSPMPYFSLVSSYGSFFPTLRMSAGQLLRGGAGFTNHEAPVITTNHHGHRHHHPSAHSGPTTTATTTTTTTATIYWTLSERALLIVVMLGCVVSVCGWVGAGGWVGGWLGWCVCVCVSSIMSSAVGVPTAWPCYSDGP